MDHRGAKAQNGPKRAWARTGALILFLLTGILLLASLHAAKSQQLPVGAHPVLPASAEAAFTPNAADGKGTMTRNGLLHGN